MTEFSGVAGVGALYGVPRLVSLPVRLFANMVAGHVMFEVFATFTVLLGGAGLINGVQDYNWVKMTYGFNMTRSPAATVCVEPSSSMSNSTS